MFKNEIKFITKRFSPNIILSIYKQNFHPFSQNSKQFMDRHTKDQFVKKAKLVNYIFIPSMNIDQEQHSK